MHPADATRHNRAVWDSFSARYQEEARSHHDADVWWGPSIASERELGVLGHVQGKDVLEIGAGAGQAGMHLAERGARVTCTDISETQLAHGRAIAAQRGLGIAFVQASADDLRAFEDASFDVVFSAYAYGFVPDIAHACKEAARVLRPGGLFAFSWSSPLQMSTVLAPDGRVDFDRSYFDRAPHVETDEHGTVVSFHCTYGDWHRALVDAGLVVTDILEPETKPEPNPWPDVFPLAKLRVVPGTTIWRAIKPRTLAF